MYRSAAGTDYQEIEGDVTVTGESYSSEVTVGEQKTQSEEVWLKVLTG